ncbi:MAG: hypothetical protein H7069_00325 [Phormidesmis sp. FL-bin-119]|nr:hypothetical protein [Pedobacter sp.]
MITKTLIMICLVLAGTSISFAQPAKIISLDITKVTDLKAIVAPFLQLTLAQIKGRVPSASGLNFIGCPNCHAGAQDMGVLN